MTGIYHYKHDRDTRFRLIGVDAARDRDLFRHVSGFGPWQMWLTRGDMDRGWVEEIERPKEKGEGR